MGNITISILLGHGPPATALGLALPRRLAHQNLCMQGTIVTVVRDRHSAMMSSLDCRGVISGSSFTASLAERGVLPGGRHSKDEDDV